MKRQINGKTIRTLRKQARLRQEDLAVACERTKYTIGRIERGQLQPSRELQARLAEFFKIPTEQLFGDSGAAEAAEMMAGEGHKLKVSPLEYEMCDILRVLPAEAQEKLIGLAYCLQAGVDVPSELAQLAVDLYRARHPVSKDAGAVGVG